MSATGRRLSRPPERATHRRISAVAVIENFGYRQLNNFWRVKGWWQFLRGDQGWGEMTRTGLGGAKK